MFTWPSKALIDAVCTITPRSPSSSGSLSANAAAARRARLNGPQTWSSRFASSVSFAIGDAVAATSGRLGITTPVALTAIENAPSPRPAIVGDRVVVVAVAGDRNDSVTEFGSRWRRSPVRRRDRARTHRRRAATRCRDALHGRAAADPSVHLPRRTEPTAVRTAHLELASSRRSARASSCGPASRSIASRLRLVAPVSNPRTSSCTTTRREALHRGCDQRRREHLRIDAVLVEDRVEQGPSASAHAPVRARPPRPASAAVVRRGGQLDQQRGAPRIGEDLPPCPERSLRRQRRVQPFDVPLGSTPDTATNRSSSVRSGSAA